MVCKHLQFIVRPEQFKKLFHLATWNMNSNFSNSGEGSSSDQNLCICYDGCKGMVENYYYTNIHFSWEEE